MALNFWATFVRKFMPKKFKKSPNLVTLSSPFNSDSFIRSFFHWSDSFEAYFKKLPWYILQVSNLEAAQV